MSDDMKRDLAVLPPGQTTQKECEWLWNTARSIEPPGIIVELGSFMGKSTCALAKGMRPGVSLVAIDSWEFVPGKFSRDLSDNGYRLFSLNLVAREVPIYTYKVNALKGGLYTLRLDIGDAARLFDDETIDMLWNDGDHYGIAKQLRLWHPKVKDDGIHCGHDYSAHWGGGIIIEAVDEFFDSVERPYGAIWLGR